MIRQLTNADREKEGAEKITGEVGYLRVGSLNTDSKHIPTYTSEQASGTTGKS